MTNPISNILNKIFFAINGFSPSTRRLLMPFTDFAIFSTIGHVLFLKNNQDLLHTSATIFVSSLVGVWCLKFLGVYRIITIENNAVDSWIQFSVAAFFTYAIDTWILELQTSLVILAIVLSTLVLIVIRSWTQRRYSKAGRSKVAIYGAGSAGNQLIAAIQSMSELEVVCFIDDDKHLIGRVIRGAKIYNSDNLLDLIRQLNIDRILLAIPSLASPARNKITLNLAKLPIRISSIPRLDAIIQGRAALSDFRDLSIDELLGRKPVEPIPDLLHENVSGKNVLVTGAGGSIGGELAKQILRLAPNKIVLCDNSEFALYNIEQELLKINTEKLENNIISVLANICDTEYMEKICRENKISIVYHAAAYKHVPLVERNKLEALKNNILGTLSLTEAAERSSVNKFVLISTDKAVRPTNVMGASKRLSELILQAKAADQKTNMNYCMVRFGNVLGSSGSVVPRFWEQIENGGPVTVTDNKVERFFMSIPEAAQLVLQASTLANQGDLFLLDMGKPVKIIDLARVMIHSSGKTVRDHNDPFGDIEIIETGLRPGEKLFEELTINGQSEATIHPKILKITESYQAWEGLEVGIEKLRTAIDDMDEPAAMEILESFVEKFKRTN